MSVHDKVITISSKSRSFLGTLVQFDFSCQSTIINIRGA
ncbi:hypothetical protein ES708_15194 [subsurface metagenome]